MATSLHHDEIIADSEEEREVDVISVIPHSRPRDTGVAAQSSTAEAALKYFLNSADNMPLPNDDPSTISSFTASRHIADTSIESIDASIPLVRTALASAISAIESISTVPSDAPITTKKPRPRPRPRFSKAEDQATADSVISSVSNPRNAPAPQLNAESVSITRPSRDEQSGMVNINRDISLISSPSTSRNTAVPALDLLGARNPPSTKGKARAVAGVVPNIITISSDQDHDAPAGAPPTRKTKASTCNSVSVPPAKSASASTASRPIKNRKIRVASDSEDPEEDPMLLKVVRQPVQAIGQPPTAPLPQALQADAGSDSDFNPIEAATKRKTKRKSNAAVEVGEENEEQNAPKKKTKGKEKEKSSKRKSRSGGEDLLKDSQGVKALASTSRGSVVKSKQFIEDSDEEGKLHLLFFYARKLEDDSSVKKPMKRTKLYNPEGPEQDIFGDGRTQRSSIRVAVAKSVAEVAAQELHVAEKMPTDKPQDGTRVKLKKKQTNGDHSAGAEADQRNMMVLDEEGAVVEKAGKKSQSKKQTVAEVVLDARPAAQNIVKPPIALDPAAPEPLQQVSEPEPVVDIVPPPVTKARLPEHVVGKISRPSTPATTTPTPQGRGSVPYWRRPNKPLTDILTQTTPGSQARPSGLDKRISIVPLHLNRKPPPPPLPPMPRKSKVIKGGTGSGSDDDEDETPRARLKRLAAEFEALEGMDSKKANDRRKEINEEMGRLVN
ncbi:hypothetical protein FRB98_004830 [Tulasnella sp. 332]|nr:hypothetical protein FRB98_004830 [Tulasnella sp. 332]